MPLSHSLLFKRHSPLKKSCALKRQGEDNDKDKRSSILEDVGTGEKQAEQVQNQG
jgi:hypothetical protein